MDLHYISRKGGRFSFVLREEMQLSGSLVNKLKWDERLLVNGVPRHTDFEVQPGDEITVKMEHEQPQYPAEDGPLSILYEDEALLAVDKPAGMLIHPSRCRNTGTLANLVLGYYRKTNQDCVFHPVTRLDRDTFGVVLLAKNPHIHDLMNRCNSEGGLFKVYEALVYGAPPERSGTVDAPIARKPLPSLLREVSPEGKPARTEYRVLEQDGGISRLWLRPVTGRTHQLRLHCAWIGCPILGDPQYGSEASQAFSAALGLESQVLCARELRFLHPVTGEMTVIRSGLEAALPPGGGVSGISGTAPAYALQDRRPAGGGKPLK